MTKDQPVAPAATITVAQAARVLTVSETMVRKLCRDGHVPRLPDGRVPIVGAVQGYIRFLADDARRAAKSASASGLQDAKTAEVHARIAQKHQELMPIEDAEAALDDVLATVQVRLAGLTARITRDPQLRRLVQKQFNEAIAEMQVARDEAVDALRSGHDIAVPPPKSGSR